MRKLLKVLTVFLLLSTVVCYAAPKAAAAKKAPAKKAPGVEEASEAAAEGGAEGEAKEEKAAKAPAEQTLEEKLDSLKVEDFTMEKPLPLTSAIQAFLAKIKDKVVIISVRAPGKMNKPVKVSLKQKTLRECLDEFCKGGFSWSLTGKSITIVPNNIDYSLDNSFVAGFIVDSCPAKTALQLMQKRIAPYKVVINARFAPDMERSISLDIRRRVKVRAALNMLRRYGYVWSKSGQSIVVTPVGKASEWKTGFGSLKLMDGNPAWVTRSRVRNAKFVNAPFSDIEKLLRTQKYRVSGLKTPVRVTMAAGYVQLKQFLTAVCMATGLDCEVSGQQIRFKKGPGIGFYPVTNAWKKTMVRLKYPVTRKPLAIGELLQKAPASMAWVFLHVRGMNMKYFRASIPADISGMPMIDAAALIEKVLNVNIHYVSNGVALMIPHPDRSRQQFARRLQMPLSDLNMQNVSLKQILDEVHKQSLKQDKTGQGIPSVIALKKVPSEKVTVEIPEIKADEFLRRLSLALECYGYVSKCGTSYILVKSGLFGIKGIQIVKMKPLVLKSIPSVDCIDIPLDFAAIHFKDVTVESILQYLNVLAPVRFGNKMSVRWGIVEQDILKHKVSFEVENPTLRSILDALSVRSRISVDIRLNSVYISAR